MTTSELPENKATWGVSFRELYDEATKLTEIAGFDLTPSRTLMMYEEENVRASGMWPYETIGRIATFDRDEEVKVAERFEVAAYNTMGSEFLSPIFTPQNELLSDRQLVGHISFRKHIASTCFDGIIFFTDKSEAVLKGEGNWDLDHKNTPEFDAFARRIGLSGFWKFIKTREPDANTKINQIINDADRRTITRALRRLGTSQDQG